MGIPCAGCDMSREEIINALFDGLPFFIAVAAISAVAFAIRIFYLNLQSRSVSKPESQSLQQYELTTHQSTDNHEKPLLDSSWADHAYPLQQILITLQGTKHSDRQQMILLLEEVLERLKLGDRYGMHHDDDFGYEFKSLESNETAFSESCAFK